MVTFMMSLRTFSVNGGTRLAVILVRFETWFFTDPLYSWITRQQVLPFYGNSVFVEYMSKEKQVFQSDFIHTKNTKPFGASLLNTCFNCLLNSHLS